MAGQLNITSACYIKSNSVVKNNQVILTQANDLIETLFPALYKHLEINYPKFYKMDNLSRLGFLASEVLLKDSFDKSLYQAEDVGIILCNANSSLDADIKYWESAQGVPSPALFVYTLPNIVIGEICIRNGFKGEHAFYVLPDFDTAFIYQQVKYLFDNDIVKACICGWIDVPGEDYEARLFLVEEREGGAVFEMGSLE